MLDKWVVDDCNEIHFGSFPSVAVAPALKRQGVDGRVKHGHDGWVGGWVGHVQDGLLRCARNDNFSMPPSAIG